MQRLYKYLFFFFFTLLASKVFLFFVAEILTLRPLRELKITKSADNYSSSVMRGEMIKRVELSLFFNDKNANAHVLLGDLYVEEIRANKEFNPLLFRLAELSYLNAIESEPSWDLAWARLVLLYNNTNKENLEYKKLLHSLITALELGKYEVDTQESLLPVIFERWNLLSSNTKGQLLRDELIRHAFSFHTHSELTLNLAKSHNLIDEVLLLAVEEWQVNRLNLYNKEKRQHD